MSHRSDERKKKQCDITMICRVAGESPGTLLDDHLQAASCNVMRADQRAIDRGGENGAPHEKLARW